MHVPTDRSLSSWIRELEAAGQLYKFYKSPEWTALAASVMDDHHHECEDCAAKGAWVETGSGWTRSKTRFLRRAETVHHDFEVRRHPDMALTRWVADENGKQKEVLHAICNLCHNERHHRFGGKVPSTSKFINVERW